MIQKLKLLIMCSIFSCSTVTTDAQESIYDIKINSIKLEKRLIYLSLKVRKSYL